MKPDNFERNQALASEYVVGTLQGTARKRFERWMMESSRLRRQVWYWERRLEPFNSSLPKIEPPPQLWNNIEQRLFAETRSDASKEEGASGIGLSFWRWTTGLALAAVLALLVWTPLPAPPAPGLVGVVQSEQAQPLWVMNAAASDHSLTLRALPPVTPASANQDYELWLLPESGVPISLTVLPTEGAELRITLSNEQVKALLASRSLAISLEPKGGSPTGQPTGPVVYQTQLVEM